MLATAKYIYIRNFHNYRHTSPVSLFDIAALSLGTTGRTTVNPSTVIGHQLVYLQLATKVDMVATSRLAPGLGWQSVAG